MTVRVLCTGDIHIGRRSGRVTGAYRSAAIWGMIVDLAIAQAVDLLAVSGDVIDHANTSYEAIGPLQHGLGRLRDAAIETVAVTGNHDHDVLPRLAGTAGTDRFHLLGLGGQWERFSLCRDGAPVLHIDGWSFPREHVTTRPIDTYARAADDGVPVLGLVHGEVGSATSRYAPIGLDSLWGQGVDLWLLGHIHGARLFPGPGHAAALYPGSPLALDPGETGVHGVWLAEIGDDRIPRLTEFPLSPVRYIETTIDVGDVADEDDFQQRLGSELVALGRRALQDHADGPLRTVSARLRFTGRCAAHAGVPVWIERARQDLSPYPVDSITIEIDEMRSEVRPHIDLHALAARSDPAGETAKLILALDEASPDPVYEDLIRRTLGDMQAVYRHAGYAALRTAEGSPGEGEPREEDARALLFDRAWDVLSTLETIRERP